MTTAQKTSKITAYFLHHKANGLTDDEAIDHIANGLGIDRNTVLFAIHHFLTN